MTPRSLTYQTRIFQSFIMCCTFHTHSLIAHSTNPSGTPFFKGMMQHLETTANTPFIGYCNGDLLFASSFVRSLSFLLDKIRKNELMSKVFRFQFDLCFDSHCGTSSQRKFRHTSRNTLWNNKTGRVYHSASADRLVIPNRRGGLFYLHERNVQLG